ncbi:MAG: hypothetical protein R3281_00125 [Balneolaceae bacterium]|nr:hypothetical protein [Balneolaceae bacterium]
MAETPAVKKVEGNGVVPDTAIGTPSANEPAVKLPMIRSWESFGMDDGLPSNKISTVKIDEIRDWVWVGTDKGIAILKENKWEVISTDEGLSHNYILDIDISQLTGEVWIATMSGLSRWSAGELHVFDQFNSGLANDVVYAVVSDSQHVWTATAAGASKFNIYTDQWDIFNEQNAPMHEPWTYGIEKGEDKIYIAAWGGGVLEYFKSNGRFRVHRDPDHQMEIDLYPNDGIVHDITTGVSYQQGILWVGTYFGLSRYDGTHWESYFADDSGLTSDFINQVKAWNQYVFVCTDNGLNTFDGQRWVNYMNNGGEGEIIIHEGANRQLLSTTSTIPNNYIWGMDIHDGELWIATDNGLARGIVETQRAEL